MAEDKKPKIDLKARLQKTQGIPAQATPAPAPVSGPPPSGPVAPGSIPAPAIPAPVRSAPVSIPAPSLPGGAAAETLGGLARGVASGPFRAQPEPPPPPPQPQRIEVDEATVQAARKGALKTAMVAAVGVSVLFGALGYVIGGARQQSAGRELALKDAKDLASKVGEAKTTLDALKTKTEAARDALLKEGKFPDALITELGGLNVDFDGKQLAGRRFSGFSTSAVQELVAFVTAVQDLNDKKDSLARVLTRLQKPLTERLQNAAANKATVTHVVVVGQDDYAILAPLVTPVSGTPPRFDFPKDLTFTDPFSKKNSSLPRYTGGPLTKPSAVYVIPKSIDNAFPSEASQGAAQLAVQLSSLLRDIKGDEVAADSVSDGKPGLIDRATKLETSLNQIK